MNSDLFLFFCVTLLKYSLDRAVSLSLSVCLHSCSWLISLSLCCLAMSLLLSPRFSVCLPPPTHPHEPALMSALPGACHIRRGNNP